MTDPRVRERGAGAIVRELYRAAVDAASPQHAVAAALSSAEPKPPRRVRIIALGKAAAPMAEAAVAHLCRSGGEPADSLIVGAASGPSPHRAIMRLEGDHPIPGRRSCAAADALGRTLDHARRADTLWVLLSGGATSLAAAPVDGMSTDDLAEIYALLLRSGMDIARMNAVRKRFTRWGAGRLAASARGAHIRALVISDVIGDDLSTIASGPCMPDPLAARDVRKLLEDASLWALLPLNARRYLELVENDPREETPKPTHPAFDRVEHVIVASNSRALAAVAGRAPDLDVAVRIVDAPLVGEAAAAGAMIARELLGIAARPSAGPRGAAWGGETTVRMASHPTNRGGRCQELALACARELHAAGAHDGITLLAAGTDGRDGYSDAAGAVIDGSTWSRIIAAGRDPEQDLAMHASHDALAAGGALLRTGLTGTNVMDVVIGLCTG